LPFFCWITAFFSEVAMALSAVKYTRYTWEARKVHRPLGPCRPTGPDIWDKHVGQQLLCHCIRAGQHILHGLYTYMLAHI
jgi:hypothetical protein